MTDHLRPHDAALARLQALHPKAIDLSLGRLEGLLHKLGDPHLRLPPTIHVAGTNGKGSTIAFLRGITEAAGLSVHVFTSPHLVRFAERIRLGGTLISDEALADVLARTEAANAGEPITLFEITAAAAFLAFSETPADVLLLEVGLGGRFDATNVIPTPKVAVIAPVDYDHREFLGDDLGGIAREKAGILKAGGLGVVAYQQDAAREAIEAETERAGATLLMAGRDWDGWAEAGRLAVSFGWRFLDLPPPALPGAHQIGNAALAAVAALSLGDERIDDEAVTRGIASAQWPARLQRLTAGPLAAAAQARGADLWLDGGHNPHAARALADFARSLTARDGRPVTAIVGLLANKDATGVFEALGPAASKVVCVGFEAAAPADPETLVQAAREAGCDAQAAPDVTAGLALALASEGPAPHVVICGSLYRAGEVLALDEATWPR
ncbi:folylpolyglutamate synthase/dihydrofolate synthase family protein [soil metagenome]